MYLATTKIAAEMPPNLKLSAAIFCLREFIQIAMTAQQDKTDVYNVVQYSTIQYNTVQYVIVLYRKRAGQGSVVQKMNSDIHGVVIFPNFLNMLTQTHIKVQHFRVEVTFYLSRVPYAWCHCFLCLSAAVEKNHWRIDLSPFRTRAPGQDSMQCFQMSCRMRLQLFDFRRLLFLCTLK